MESLDNYLSVGWGLAHQAYSNLTLEWVINRILTAPARYRRWWLHLLEHAPGHVIVETALIIFILWLLFFKKTEDPYKEELHLTEKEIDELVAEWKPEPLTPEPDPVWYEDPNVVVTRVDGNLLHATGYAKPLLNFGTFDFLGMSQRPEVKDAARACLLKYGCGSCGPRGFYGTIDVHVHCEEAVSRFLGTEEAISYSDSASAVSSTLPAFAKRGDLLLIDEGASEPILTAANLSRSTVKFFKHNDMKDLERLLKGIASEDKRVNRNALEQRRFIVAEGLYKNFGDTAPLKELIALKKKYFYRLFLDETHSFGCYGKGRGITELYDVPITEIDILCVSMAHALASVGGLCAGTHEVVDHQRLSGAGYCFSASAPPFVSGAAVAAIKILENEPGLVDRLQENARRLHDGIATITGLEVRSERGSPILHVGMSPSLNLSRNDAAALLRRIANLCLQDGIAIVTSKFVGDEPLVPPPSLRITVCATHTTEHLDEALAVLRRVTAAILEA